MENTLKQAWDGFPAIGSIKRLTLPFRRYFFIRFQGGLSRAFRARIHLVVAEANGCKFCNYLRTLDAIKAGVSRTELKKVLRGNVALVPEFEQVALLFARHYVETRGKPDPMSVHRFRITYGEKLSEEIIKLVKKEQAAHDSKGGWRTVRNRFRDMQARDLVEGKRKGIVISLILIPLAIFIGILYKKYSSTEL